MQITQNATEQFGSLAAALVLDSRSQVDMIL